MTITLDPESFKQLCLLALGTLTILTIVLFVVIKTVSDWFNK
jgi:hypothetical protein